MNTNLGNTLESQIAEIIETILSVKGNDNFFLHEPVVVRLSPHTYPFEIHGLCVSPKRKLFIMNEQGNWDQLEETDVNADKMVSSIYQRIKMITPKNIRA